MNDENSVFGLGDVYGLSALRFMLGFSDSLWGLLLTHILSLVYDGLCSLSEKRPFLKNRIRMGFPMFISTVVLMIDYLLRET